MNLRSRKDIDYRRLHDTGLSDNTGFYDTMAEKMGEVVKPKKKWSRPSKQIYQSEDDMYDADTSSSEESDKDTVIDQSVEEMAAELEQLDLEEKKLELKVQLDQKKANVAKLRSQSATIKAQKLKKETQLKHGSSKVRSSHDRIYYPDSMQVPPYYGETQAQSSRHPHSMRMDLDPQAYLKVASKEKSEYRSVVDFVPRSSRRKKDEEEYDFGKFVMSMKSGPKPKLENTSPAQWVSANALILAEIIKNDEYYDLKELVLDYLSHTCKIGEMANRYTWSSVMIYDDDYREKQSSLSFCNIKANRLSVHLQGL